MLKMSHDSVPDLLETDHELFQGAENFYDVPLPTPEANDLFNEGYSLIKKIADICNTHLGVQPKRYERETAAKSIQKWYRNMKNKMAFEHQKARLDKLRQTDPIKVLQMAKDGFSKMFDRRFFKIIFRFDGKVFPPLIVYKVISKPTHFETGIVDKSLVDNWPDSRWLPFRNYKCEVCKINVAYRLSAKKRKKSDVRNSSNWLREITR